MLGPAVPRQPHIPGPARGPTPQDVLYQKTAMPIVDFVLDGFNGTIFAYGQTGTGKTVRRCVGREYRIFCISYFL